MSAPQAAPSALRVEFRDILARRRMVRSYRPEPVARETIERIVATVRRAPSAGFSQGQSLVVVTDAATRRAIAERAGEGEYVARGGAPWMSTPPVHIVVCANERLYHERYRKPDKLALTGGEEIRWPVPYWFVDAGAALALVLLAAIDEGLGAGFFGHPDQETFLRELLGLPGDVVPIGVAVLGYEADDPGGERLTSRLTERRRPPDEVVHWERWGGVAR
jgi:FMN reductase [NAD(P)H]